MVGGISVHGDVPGFDQSAPAAEQWAALQAAWALNEASVVQAWLIIDDLLTVNGVKSTISGVGRDHTDYYGLWRAFAALTGRIDLRCDHVPSHGKQPNWRPLEGEDVGLRRSLNKAADSAATQALKNACFVAQGPARERHAAKRWAHSAMLAQVAAIKALHLRYPRTPTRDRRRSNASGPWAASEPSRTSSCCRMRSERASAAAGARRRGSSGPPRATGLRTRRRPTEGSARAGETPGSSPPSRSRRRRYTLS